MTGQLVQLLISWHKLPKGTEGMVCGSNERGWVAVFGAVSITLPFRDEGVVYRFRGGA